MAFEEYWNKTFKKLACDKPAYDDWLDKYLDLIKKDNGQILVLGCGTGNDSLYLDEKGFDVLSTDYSIEALNNTKRAVPNAKTKPGI